MHYEGKCRVGYYCQEGNLSSTACPVGTCNQFTEKKSLSNRISW